MCFDRVMYCPPNITCSGITTDSNISCRSLCRQRNKLSFQLWMFKAQAFINMKYVVELLTDWLKCRTQIKALFIYISLFLSENLDYLLITISKYNEIFRHKGNCTDTILIFDCHLSFVIMNYIYIWSIIIFLMFTYLNEKCIFIIEILIWILC